MSHPKLFMILLGCTPPGRNTEQHDVFFSIGTTLKDMVPEIIGFWPEANGKVHIDAWREVSSVDGYAISVTERPEKMSASNHGPAALFFINLGGYRENQFEEFHYKMLVVADSVEMAKARAKTALFFKQASMPDSPTSRVATAHIDDKYGIDVDDIYPIQDILPANLKDKYEIRISQNIDRKPDDYHLGYLQLMNI